VLLLEGEIEEVVDEGIQPPALLLEGGIEEEVGDVRIRWRPPLLLDGGVEDEVGDGRIWLLTLLLEGRPARSRIRTGTEEVGRRRRRCLREGLRGSRRRSGTGESGRR
jgi:hypothetical protein